MAAFFRASVYKYLSNFYSLFEQPLLTLLRVWYVHKYLSNLYSLYGPQPFTPMESVDICIFLTFTAYLINYG